MSSLVHSVVSDIITSYQRLQQPQQQQQIPSSEIPQPHLDSNNNTGCTFPVEESKQKTDNDASNATSFKPGSSGEKYSLRPRSLQRRPEAEESEQAGLSSSRSGTRRGVTPSSGTTGRPKQKPPPLSKYRRKTANARERDRMREINAAFETLRRAVPHISQSAHHSQHENSSGEKLTKITTLRLAMKYIAALSQALQQADALVPDSSSTSSLHLMSDGESITFSEHCLTPPDLTPPDLRQSLTPSIVARLSPADHYQHRVPLLDSRRQCLNTADLNRRTLGSSTLSHSQKCIISSSQNIIPSPHLVNPLPAASGVCHSSSQNLPSGNMGRHCILTNPANSNPSICITTPVMARTCLQPPELNQHCLTTVDFEETPPEDPSTLLVFDDDSLESPDLDHLLIS